MMTFEKHVKKFIEDHIELVDKLKFDELYRLAERLFGPTDVGSIYTVFNSCGVDVLKYFEVAPDFILFRSTLNEVHIPEGVVELGNRSFDHSSIRKLYLPKSLKRVQYDTFNNFKNLKELHYPGTFEDFFQIDFMDVCLTDINKLTRICLDGVSDTAVNMLNKLDELDALFNSSDMN